jgi:hypothetical protein
VLDGYCREGPFNSMLEAVMGLKQISEAWGHRDEEARHFFLRHSAIEQVETQKGRLECIRLSWLEQGESGMAEVFQGFASGTRGKSRLGKEVTAECPFCGESRLPDPRSSGPIWLSAKSRTKRRNLSRRTCRT